MDDALEVIPSSQCDEDEEETTATANVPDQSDMACATMGGPDTTAVGFATAVESPQTPVDAVAMVTRVENSQADISIPPAAPLLSPTRLIADTMPFTQQRAPKGATQAAGTVIEDTENTENQAKEAPPTIYITGSNLSAIETVSRALSACVITAIYIWTLSFVELAAAFLSPIQRRGGESLHPGPDDPRGDVDRGNTSQGCSTHSQVLYGHPTRRVDHQHTVAAQVPSRQLPALRGRPYRERERTILMII